MGTYTEAWDPPQWSDWFAMGYQDGYNVGEWWSDADYLDDEDLEAYTDGYMTGTSEREADW